MTVSHASTMPLGGFSVLNATSSRLAAWLLSQRFLGKQSALFFANTNFIVQCGGLQASMDQPGILIANDGVGMDIAAQLIHGERFRDNLNGTDFIPYLFEQAEEPLRVFLLGGKPDIVRRAAEHVVHGLGQKVVGYCDGYHCIKHHERLIATINEARTDVLLVALGNPVQEKWILDHRETLNVPIVAGVGALFDFWAGGKPRAPRAVQKLRMEWFYRLCLEPKRLARRYTIDIVKFLKYCFAHR